MAKKLHEVSLMGERSKLLLVGLFVAHFGVAIAFLLNAVAGRPDPTFTRLIDLNGEFNLPAYTSAFQLALSGLLAAAVAYKVRLDRFATIGLALFLFAMAADEVWQFHEWFGHRSDVLLPFGLRSESALPRTGIWMLLLGPPAVLCAAVLIKAGSRHFARHPASGKLIAAGFILLFTGAIGIELFSNLTARGSLASVVQVTVEELFEMLGGAMILTGCALWHARASAWPTSIYRRGLLADTRP